LCFPAFVPPPPPPPTRFTPSSFGFRVTLSWLVEPLSGCFFDRVILFAFFFAFPSTPFFTPHFYTVFFFPLWLPPPAFSTRFGLLFLLTPHNRPSQNCPFTCFFPPSGHPPSPLFPCTLRCSPWLEMKHPLFSCFSLLFALVSLLFSVVCFDPTPPFFFLPPGWGKPHQRVETWVFSLTPTPPAKWFWRVVPPFCFPFSGSGPSIQQQHFVPPPLSPSCFFLLSSVLFLFVQVPS